MYNNKKIFWAALIIIAAIAVIIITTSWPNFSHSYDEPAHLATGLEWWQFGKYSYEPLHPPLARIFIAALPFLDGVRLVGGDIFTNGTAALGTFTDYWHNLTLARIGTLPFTILAIITVGLWGRALFNVRAGIITTAIFALLPQVLSHGGLATTDMAATATYIFACFIFYKWLEKPQQVLALVLGIAVGAALASKFLNLIMLSISFIIILLLCWQSHVRPLYKMLSVKNIVYQFFIFSLVCFLFLWAVYRFDIGSIGPGLVERQLASPGQFMLPLPAPNLWLGLIDGFLKNNIGHAVYILEKPLDHAVWYFFPVAIFFKTPIAILILLTIGAWAILFDYYKQGGAAQTLIPLGIIIAMLAFLASTNVNLGTRHALAIFPWLAIVAGTGLETLWQQKRILVVSLFGLAIIATTITTYPDYLAFFNRVAGDSPEEILIDSDLDWGQDMGRLAEAMNDDPKAWQDSSIFDFSTVNLPALTKVPHNRIGYIPAGWRPAGRIAVSVGRTVMDKSWDWLDNIAINKKIGRTILVYDIANITSRRDILHSLISQELPAPMRPISIQANAGLYDIRLDNGQSFIHLRQNCELIFNNPNKENMQVKLTGIFKSTEPTILMANDREAATITTTKQSASIEFNVPPGQSIINIHNGGIESGRDYFNRPFAIEIENPMFIIY